MPLAAENIESRQMRYISKEDGLPGETVSHIVTAPDGQVWLATNDGVCRYNGREVTAFAMPRKGATANYTYQLAFAPDKTLYAATREGLFEIKRGAAAFTRVYSSLDRVETMLVVGDTIFAGNRQGFHVLHGGKVRTITVGATPMGIENGIRDIRMGNDRAVWFISRYGLHRYDLKTGRVSSHNLATLLPERTALSRMLPCGKRFYIGTKNNGLYIYDLTHNKMTRIPEASNVVNAMETAPDGKITVCAGRALLIDAATGKVERQFSKQGDGEDNILPTEGQYCYYRDNNGVDWFGFYRYGMAYRYHSDPLFKTYSLGDFTTEGIDVRTVLVNGKHKIIGAADDIWLVDEQSRHVRHYSSEELGNAHSMSTLAYFNGCYYAGSYDGGLRRFSASTFGLLPNPPEPLLSATTTSAITPDGRGNLWIGTGEGLFILDGNDHLTHYTENNSKIIGGQIQAIRFMPNGNAWISGPNGLCIAITQKGKAGIVFERASTVNGFFGANPIKEINSGHDGLFFFNSTSNIFYSDPSMRRYGEIESVGSIISSGCTSFIDDGAGRYWIAMSDGLSCIDYDGGNMLHFGYGEGLRCQVIGGKLSKDATGTLWIGTSNGLAYIRPADLKPWLQRTRYKMVLYHIAVDGNPVGTAMEDEANDNHRLTMQWNLASSVMTLRPVLTDYARPYGRLYEYRIDGEKQWSVVRDGEDIRLHKLSLGSHKLHVRLAGVAGTQTSYTITVSPSGWAIIELLLLIAAIVALVLWQRYHKKTTRLLDERNDIEDALMEAEAEAAQSETKLENRTAKATQKGEKYERVHLDEDECRDIVERMRRYIEEEKVFLNPDLKMSDIADWLHVSPSKLSQVFSLYLNDNWYDFINAYRLAEFKRLIGEGLQKQYTLLAISARCGFKKSSFFTTFRKVEGMTPTEYMNKKTQTHN